MSDDDRRAVLQGLADDFGALEAERWHQFHLAMQAMSDACRKVTISLRAVAEAFDRAIVALRRPSRPRLPR